MIFRNTGLSGSWNWQGEKEVTGYDPQPGGGSRYNGDHEKVRQRSKRSDPLLFLFTGDGTGVCENGLLLSESVVW